MDIWTMKMMSSHWNGSLRMRGSVPDFTKSDSTRVETMGVRMMGTTPSCRNGSLRMRSSVAPNFTKGDGARVEAMGVRMMSMMSLEWKFVNEKLGST
jgi:hypothetical protein